MARPGTLDFHAERAQASPSFDPVDTLAEDPAVIIYTSGTTGPPKGACHAQRVLLGHLPGVEISHDLFPQPSDRIWTPADWAWIGGLFDVLMPAWHHGITVVSHRLKSLTRRRLFNSWPILTCATPFCRPPRFKLMRTVTNPPALAL
ncbi:MAG: AMP-binding protein [Caldilineaceae bacterium]